MILKSTKLASEGIRNGIRYRINRRKNRHMKPTFLIWQITDRCNSRCGMCNIWKKKPGQELAQKEIENIFKNRLFSKLRWINLTGGEPFLRDDFTQAISALSKLKSLEVIAVPTNGFMTDRIVKTVKQSLSLLPKNKSLSVTVSIDGFETTHDKIRGVKGAFDKALATLESLLALAKEHHNLKVGVQPTITKANVNEIEEFYDFIKEYTPNIGFAVMMESEGYYGNTGSDLSLNDEDRERIAHFLEDTLKETPQYGYYYTKLAKMFKTKRRDFPCLAGFVTMYMNPKGNIYPCPVLSSSSVYDFGNAKDNAHFKWFSDDATKIKIALKNEEACKRCSMMCDLINMAKVEFFSHAFFLMQNPKIAYRLAKKIKASQDAYF